jgi:nitroimidazol reductase NimA-like FMN-containing flavoprotein (pyridoxamine 5'-phosphate oxidase superfamily)
MKTVGLDERVIEDRGEMEEVLRVAKVGRLCLCQNDQPLIIPVNFAYENGAIYFHGSDPGLKAESLRKNPNVCFEVDEFLGTVPASVPCEYDTAYRSVVAFGTAQVLSSPDENTLSLQLIVSKYAGEEEARSLTLSMVEKYRSSRGRKTTVVKIQINKMTGRRSINRPEVDSD